ncbi:uncharacterized protein B0T15DRAFT_571512 [Chaetomium strumarium]|uniref:Uncharacterized protein n=1 Tax=Chaetomium strumarium TaxID=1170767 RepID=A0AAJ0M6N7_9PEZI|nr:hypothetical protein B0T15DRAFT_571512 [Chaetomium strumarium]
MDSRRRLEAELRNGAAFYEFIRSLTTNANNDLLTRLFDKATRLTQQRRGDASIATPLAYKQQLKRRLRLRAVWSRCPPRFFIMWFSLLRAARERRRNDPRSQQLLERETESRRRLRRAIDAFLDADTLDWSRPAPAGGPRYVLSSASNEVAPQGSSEMAVDGGSDEMAVDSGENGIRDDDNGAGESMNVDSLEQAMRDLDISGTEDASVDDRME